MSLWVCLDCTTAFAVGVPRCPHCGSERHAEEGSAAALGIQASVPVEVEDSMPKITRHGGATVAGDEPAPVEDVTAPEPNEKPAPKPVRKTARSGKPRTQDTE
ncbi:hypothetical protein ADL02_19415 [Streptomyces sp. NRRL WC-3723]|nr:hypothetical protein ADL02_19415 [Streptomyces sp. NRRL WC-3723]